MKIKRFWNWVQNETTRTLYFDGVIAEDSWWGDEITPKLFRDELFSGEGDITIWLNSPGGDCIAASRIYAMLMEYKGEITIMIDGLAASAASVIAMAGTKVIMSPTAMMMIHNPLTVAIGDSDEMKKAIEMLSEFKESIINAYEIKTGLPRDEISDLMDAETWMNAYKAVELGFADAVLEDEKKHTAAAVAANFVFSRRAVTNSLFNKIKPPTKNTQAGTPVKELETRLNLLKGSVKLK